MLSLTNSSRILHNYAMSHEQTFTPAEKQRLSLYLSEQGTKAESVSDELKELQEALKETAE